MSLKIGVHHLIVFETNQFIFFSSPVDIPETPAGPSSSIRRACLVTQKMFILMYFVNIQMVLYPYPY